MERSVGSFTDFGGADLAPPDLTSVGADAQRRPSAIPALGGLAMFALARYWWVVALRGLLAVVFGLAAFLWPGITLVSLVLLFGAYALVDGIFAIISAFRTREWWPLLLEGVIGIVAGAMTFVWPGITAIALLYLIAAWAIITGILEIVAAIQLRKVITNEWLLVLGGVVSVILGVVMVVAPGAGALGLVWAIGAYALVFGVTLIALGFRLRGLRDRPEGGPTTPSAPDVAP
jgi:uncharacterized membrane protein HdeD (DUF308 family)